VTSLPTDLKDAGLLRTVCCGDEDAVRFLLAWREYVHLIDDIVDGDTAPLDVIRVGAMANSLFSCPFYLRHTSQLYVTVQLLTCAYRDSVHWEHSPDAWRRQIADVLRHSGADMVRAVALLCGGYSHLCRYSLEIHTICYQEHHDAAGNPV